jgi:outer membrane protein OmpA-like peptidoglycan-associated protein
VLNEAQRDSIISQWEAIIQAGGGCASVDPTGNTSTAVSGLPAVAVVKPPKPVLFRNCGTIVLSDAGSVGFVVGKATFRDSSSAHDTLSQLAGKLKQGSEHITIIGSTSSEGGDAVNNPLSQQRAAAVASVLTSMGIPSSRMTTVGDGAHWPGRVNDTGAGGVLLPAQAEQNRVVVVQLPRCT